MRFFVSMTLAAVSVFLIACTQNSVQRSVQDPLQHTGQNTKASTSATQVSAIQVGKDYHSFANADEIRVKHLVLDLTVDFERKVLSGSVELHLQRQQESVTTLVLDTRDLHIHNVRANGQSIAYRLAEADPHLGAALEIELSDAINAVTIEYTTSPTASGVQWLTPAQTAGKQQPFLFTQAQAIHARSFIPLQDSPQVRVSYQATIRTPKELLAVMSASNDPATERDGVYEFDMPQPIPSYLIALAVGDLAFQSMGERTGVYAEPALLKASAAEFADTESMLIATEKAYGPYRWDRYDLLILPPSFPFGGMENPRLSFITPTIIAGDKSLVSLIAHELAHSWSGNTVTNATWRDLWLNEGFTTYLTYRIMEMVYGTPRFNMEAVLGRQDLQADIDDLDDGAELLAIDLRGKDPDTVFSDVAYEKGALFLRELEHRIGRDNFDKFLMAYFEYFAFKSITTDEFLAYLDKTLLRDYPGKISKQRIDQWIFQPGIPNGAPKSESNAFVDVDNARNAWLEGRTKAADLQVDAWTYHQWKYFLNNMPAALSVLQLEALDKAFALTSTGNNEIAHSWLLICVNNNYQPAFERLRQYLISIGRNKLVKPLYRALSATPQGKAFAREVFEIAKPGYHPLTVKANQGFME